MRREPKFKVGDIVTWKRVGFLGNDYWFRVASVPFKSNEYLLELFTNNKDKCGRYNRAKNDLVDIIGIPEDQLVEKIWVRKANTDEWLIVIASFVVPEDEICSGKDE